MIVNELLAPAGNIDAVKIAIDNGADAVYCAGKKFGARAFINNLSNEEIIEASHYAHLYNKKIYITLNTLIFEEEFEEAKEYIDFLYKYVDAIIVQDYGIIHYIRKTYPDFPIHISTQCSIHNKEDILFLKSIGVSRIVLAREVSKEEIKEFNKLGIELEIFIHGALCFSYSGMCYMSYYKGGRSGNRGNCAQPCRKQYELLEDGEPLTKGALLSMKDLNTIANIKELLSLGVTSLKIEGRAKSLEYLSSVVRIYRKLIDDFNANKKPTVSLDMLDDLYSSFSREYTKGYLFNEPNKDITTNGSVKHVGIEIGKVIEYKKGQAKIQLFKPLSILDGIRILNGNKEVGLTVTRIIQNGNLVKEAKGIVIIDIKDYVAPNSTIYKTSSSKVKKDIKNTLNPYKNLLNLNIFIENGYQYYSVEGDDFKIEISKNETLEKAISVNKENVIKQFSKVNNLPIEYSNIEYKNEDNLYIPIPIINSIRNELLEMVKDYLINRKMRDNKPYSYTEEKYIKEAPLESLTINEEAEFTLINNKTTKKNVSYHLCEIKENSILSPYFGVTNHYAIDFFRHLTKGTIILSFESTDENSLSLKRFDSNLGYLVEFDEPLMISNHCPVGKYYGANDKHCLMCQKHKYQIKDNDLTYSLKFKNCIMRILGKHVKRKGLDGLIDITLD